MHAQVSTASSAGDRCHMSASNREPIAAGQAMVAELKWVHSMIRSDLRAVRMLADQVADGLPGEQAADAIESLAMNSPLWQLKINCLQYCRFVHMHHHAESVLLFPRLRTSNPDLGPVVDKLEADHARVSDLLDEVSSSANDLAISDDPLARKRLIAALAELSADLLAHLDYEEEHISGTLGTWTSWAGW